MPFIITQPHNDLTDLCALLVLDVEVVDAVHLEVLGDLEVLHHGVLPEHAAVLHVPLRDPRLPLLAAHLVLLHDPLGQKPVVLG